MFLFPKQARWPTFPKKTDVTHKLHYYIPIKGKFSSTGESLERLMSSFIPDIPCEKSTVERHSEQNYLIIGQNYPSTLTFRN